MVRDLYDVYCAKKMFEALEEFDQMVKINRAYEEYEDILDEQRRYEATSEREVWLREGPFELEEALRVLWGEWDATPLDHELEGIRHSLRRKEEVKKFLKRRREYLERGGEIESRSRENFLHNHGIKRSAKIKKPISKEVNPWKELEEERSTTEDCEIWYSGSWTNPEVEEIDWEYIMWLYEKVKGEEREK